MEIQSGIITLPEKEEMLRRLVAADNSEHLQQRFYPKLLQAAGQERDAGGVALMFSLAIYEYVEGLPMNVRMSMNKSAPKFISAIIDDQEIAEEAKSTFHKTTSDN